MFERLKNILVEELSLNADDVTMESELANDLGVNSLELADLVLVCEDEFGVDATPRTPPTASPPPSSTP